MRSIVAFKSHMLRSSSPNYIKRYCNQLDGKGWHHFYNQMLEPLEFIIDYNYLFYVMKWILKHTFIDLSLEVYLKVVMDSELALETLIQPDWMCTLSQRYNSYIDDLILEISIIPDVVGEPSVDVNF